MITIKHGRATFTVKPEHAPAVHDLLAVIDNSKGKKGPKIERPKGNNKHHSSKRDYPVFNASVMLTSDYVTAYAALNQRRLNLKPCDIEPTVNRVPAQYDFRFPVCIEESIE
jgi:hypothetical protein